MTRSIQSRMALWSGLSAATLVALVSIAVWWRMDRALRAEMDQSLLAEAAVLAQLVDNERGELTFDLESANRERPAHLKDELVNIQAHGGKTVHCSIQPDNREIWSKMLTEMPPTRPLWATIEPWTGRAYRGVAVPSAIPPDPEDGPVPDGVADPIVWVCVARSLDPLNHVLAQLTWTLACATLLALLFSLLIGRAVARAAAGPIRAVATAVERVAPGQEQLSLRDDKIPAELHPIVEKTNALLQRIQQELARQRQLTADIAHDLRTPVAGVRALLDVCLQKPRPVGEYAETIETTRTALRRLTGLLEDVLMLARLESAAESPRVQPVPLADALRAAVETVQPLADSKQVQIHTPPLQGIAVSTDPPLLDKIVMNLLANAVEHSPAGSTVTIACRQIGETVEIQVRDEGPGIPATAAEEIFNRFVRLDPARATNGHHGLGLPIARGLARKLGGDVRLLPESGPRSCFAITLPAHTSPGAEQFSRGAEQSSRGAGL